MQATIATKTNRRKPTRWIILGIVALILVGGFVWVNGRLAQMRETRDALLAQTGDTVAAFIGDLSATATASGQVEAAQTAQLSVISPGIVDDLLVQVGDTVDAGDPLVRLDTTALALQVEKAQQNLTLQQAELEALLNGADAADIASAEAAVYSAQVALENLLDGPTEQEIAESAANVRSQEANVASAAASYNSTLDSVSDSAIAAARIDLLNAQIAYDNAKEVNEDFANSATHEALQEAATDLAIAQTALDNLLAGPNQGNVSSAAANISAAQANVDQANANYQTLLSGPTAPQIAAAQANLAQAEANLAQLIESTTVEDIAIAEAEVAQAAVALADAEEGLAKATITAPFAGMITAVSVNPGEYATGNAIEIVATDLKVILSVDEIDIGILTVGQEAIITMETWPDVEISSEIVSIAPNANANNTIVTYDVQLNLAQTELPILVGMTANANLVTANNEDVLLVPNAAVNADREAGTYSVNQFMGNDEQGRPLIEAVEVTIGLRDENFTQITSGLSEGDEVILGSLNLPVLQFNGPFGRDRDE